MPFFSSHAPFREKAPWNKLEKNISLIVTMANFSFNVVNNSFYKTFYTCKFITGTESALQSKSNICQQTNLIRSTSVWMLRTYLQRLHY